MFLLFGGCFSLAISSCSKPDVIVVDESGHPLEGVSVEPISLSVNGAISVSDGEGEVNFPKGIQEVKWISLTKEGYFDSGQIDFDSSQSQRVVLKKR